MMSFPVSIGPAVQSREVLRMLRYRQKLIKIRTMSKNSLQALALTGRLTKGSRLFTRDGQAQLCTAEMSPVMQWQREHWLQLMEPLNQQSARNHGVVQGTKQRRCLGQSFAGTSGHWAAYFPSSTGQGSQALCQLESRI